jgi:hypothetical protein
VEYYDGRAFCKSTVALEETCRRKAELYLVQVSILVRVKCFPLYDESG